MEAILILPNIRSAHNVGAMFRTADACSFSKLFLVGYTATPPKPQIDKVSLGAETWVPWQHCDDLTDLILDLKKQGFFMVGLEKTNKSKEISSAKFVNKLALIVGNEVDGISSEVLDMCDLVVHINMHGKKESFNVSVAAGIAMYEIQKKIF